MKACTSMAQTKSGIRLSVMPGARFLKMVTISSTEPTSAAISVKVIAWAYTSARLPGLNSGPDRGTYPNQPTSGPVFMKNMR